MFAYHFNKTADHEPLPLDYGNADNDMLNRPLQISEFKEVYVQSRSLLRVKLWSAHHFPRVWMNALWITLFSSTIIFGTPMIFLLLGHLQPYCLFSSRANKRQFFLHTNLLLWLLSYVWIFEKIIAYRLSYYILENKILHYSHLSFQPFHESHTALNVLHHDIA